MRILVHEFVTGGGFAGRSIPRSLLREGRAMRAALVADLAALGTHHIVTTTDERLTPRVPPFAVAQGVPSIRRGTRGVQIVTLSESSRHLFDDLVRSVDAVWLIAPETDRCLERLAAKVERLGTRLLGPDAATIRCASDKAALPRLFARAGVPHPVTRTLRAASAFVPQPFRAAVWGAPAGLKACAMGTFPDYPLIVKPARGAGCRGVSLARNRRELRLAVARAGVTGARAPVIVQEYVRGTAASVSLLCDGSRAMALTVNSQTIRKSEAFSYGGGCVPFDHPLAARAIEVAVRACEAVPGLRGWVGVDLVLTRSEAVVIEINPRLTTAYVGVRAALDGNVAGLALTACAGALPSLPRVRHVRFSVDGRIRPVRGATSTARRVAS